MTWKQLGPRRGTAESEHRLDLDLTVYREDDGAVCVRFSYMRADSTWPDMYLYGAQIGLDLQPPSPADAAGFVHPKGSVHVGRGLRVPAKQARIFEMQKWQHDAVRREQQLRWSAHCDMGMEASPRPHVLEPPSLDHVGNPTSAPVPWAGGRQPSKVIQAAGEPNTSCHSFTLLHNLGDRICFHTVTESGNLLAFSAGESITMFSGNTYHGGPVVYHIHDATPGTILTLRASLMAVTTRCVGSLPGMRQAQLEQLDWQRLDLPGVVQLILE